MVNLDHIISFIGFIVCLFLFLLFVFMGIEIDIFSKLIGYQYVYAVEYRYISYKLRRT